MANNRIPKARLNQIAKRKLDAMGVTSRLSADQDRLEGVLQLNETGQLTNPLNEQTFSKVHFVVEGHDHLAITDPPSLRGLHPQQFYDFEELDKVIEQIQIRIARRAAAVRQLTDRLTAFGLNSRLDPERMRALAEVELSGTGKIRLQGDERGLYAIGLLPLAASKPIPMQTQVDLNEFGDNTDLELWLGSEAEKAVKKEKEAPTKAAERGPDLAAEPEDSPKSAQAPIDPGTDPSTVPTMKPPMPLTLGRLLELFGPEAAILPGAVMIKDLNVAGKPVRFATRVDGSASLSGKLATSDGVAWTGHFEPESFPGVEDFVAGLLGTAEVEANTPPPTQVPVAPATASPTPPAESLPSIGTPDLSAGHSMPITGEVWVMNTLVETDDGAEVRYVGIDIDGQPFGAPRVLPKEVFERVFTKVSHGVYQLPVEIIEVAPDQVAYLQLDPERNKVGDKRTSRLAPFLSNFIPEAASY